jgi:hypothetical protein
MNRFSWTPIKCARACASVFFLSACLFLFLILSCPELKFHYSSCKNTSTTCCNNIYRPGKAINRSSLLIDCSTVFIEWISCVFLVCDVNNSHMMFLSPCHYGCTYQMTSVSNRINQYSSCNCADSLTTVVSEAACEFRRIPCKMRIEFHDVSLNRQWHVCWSDRRGHIHSDGDRRSVRRLSNGIHSSSNVTSSSLQCTIVVSKHGTCRTSNNCSRPRSNNGSDFVRLCFRSIMSRMAYWLLWTKNM